MLFINDLLIWVVVNYDEIEFTAIADVVILVAQIF